MTFWHKKRALSGSSELEMNQLENQIFTYHSTSKWWWLQWI